MPYRQQGKDYEPASLLLLLGAGRSRAAVDSVFHVFWYRKLEDSCCHLGSCADSQRRNICHSAAKNAGRGRRGHEARTASEKRAVPNTVYYDALCGSMRNGGEPVGFHTGGIRAWSKQDRRRPCRTYDVRGADGNGACAVRKIRRQDKHRQSHARNGGAVRGGVFVHSACAERGHGAYRVRNMRLFGGDNVAGNVQQERFGTAERRHDDVRAAGSGG